MNLQTYLLHDPARFLWESHPVPHFSLLQGVMHDLSTISTCISVTYRQPEEAGRSQVGSSRHPLSACAMYLCLVVRIMHGCYLILIESSFVTFHKTLCGVAEVLLFDNAFDLPSLLEQPILLPLS